MSTLTIEMLAKNRVLGRLPEREAKRLLPHLRMVSLRLKQVLHRPGEHIRYAYFPLDSVVSMVAPLDDGRSVEVLLVGPEGLMGLRGLLEGKSHWHTAVVQVEGSCLRINARTLRSEFKRGGKLQEGILHYVSYLLVQTAQMAACNRVHRLKQRLARWLLMTHDRARRDEFPMTHEFLSDMLGTARPELSAAADAFRKAGLIHYRRGKLRILNRKGLEQTACECYQVIREDLDAPR